MNSFELVFHEIEGEPVIDKDYYNTKEEQCKIIIIIISKICINFKYLSYKGYYNTKDNYYIKDL